MTNRKTSAHIIVMDPAFSQAAGHHVTASRRLTVAAGRIGGRVTVLCSLRASHDVCRGLSTRPIFRTNVYRRQTYSRAEFERAVNKTLEDILSCVSPARFAADVIVLPTCDQVLAMALGQYLCMIEPQKRPSVMAWFLLQPDFLSSRTTPTPAASEAADREFSDGIACLLNASGGTSKLRLFSETRELAGRYESLLGFPVSLAASPNMHDVAAVQSLARAKLSPPRIVMMGQTNIGKGYEIVPVAIRRVLEEGAEGEFFIHAAGAAERPAYQHVFELLAGLGDRVTVCSDDLGDEAYVQLLRSADIILLPYDPAIYLQRGSGIFNEAEALGIPAIVTQGLGFAAEAVSDGRCIAADAYSGEALGRTMIEAIARFDELALNARNHAARDAQSKPATLETHLCELIDEKSRALPCANAQTSLNLSSAISGLCTEGQHRKAQIKRILHSLTKRKIWHRRLEGIRAFAHDRGLL